MISGEWFFSLSNPVIFSFLIFIIFGVVLSVFYKKIFRPNQLKHKKEKENLEHKNTRLMAMFAEMDPSPLFRFDLKGKIMLTNNEGKSILDKLGLENPPVSSVIQMPEDFNYESFIRNSGTFKTSVRINDSHYDIIMKGVQETEFGQIYCNDISVRKNAEEALEQSQKMLRALSTHIREIEEKDKMKISRELHDSFGQILTSVKINLEILQENNKDESLNERFLLLNQQLDTLRMEIRELSHRLRPRVLDDFGLAPALKSLCEDVSKSANIKSSFQVFNFNERLTPATETGIYRIVQESLNNIVKHSKASEFNVQLVKNSENIVVTIEDDGVGFNIHEKNGSSKKGIGLMNMSERALSINGKLFLSSVPGKGTEVLIEIPLSKNGKNKSTAG